MENVENSFAPFDLTKTPKFDRETDKEHLTKSFYRLAVQYYAAARFILFNQEWIPVAMTNVAFSCELFLKAILYGYDIDFKSIHGLEALFKMLPQKEQDYIANNIAIENREREFHICLHEQDKAFVEYRYMCEAKSMTGNPKFLFAFADILKFVYESLLKENGKEDELI